MTRATVLHLAIAATIVLGAQALARSASPVDRGPAPLNGRAGPVERRAPAGATVVADEAALANALAGDAPEIWLARGTYRGDLFVRRSVALRGEGGVVLEGSGGGTVVTIEAPDVTLENLRVRRSGRRHTTEDAGIRARGARAVLRDVAVEDALFGIALGPCAGCVVERAHVTGAAGDQELRGDGIKLWEASDALVRDSVVDHARDLVVWYSRRVHLERNTVRFGRYGAHFMYAHDAVVTDNHLTSNVVGIFVMYSGRVRMVRNVLSGGRGAAGVGVGFKESDDVTMTGNWIVGNTTGVYLDRTPRSVNAPAVLDGNVIALNDVAARFHGADESVFVRRNDFRANVVPVEVEGGGDAMGVAFEGNHWSDYAGYDLDGDGVGDVPHEVKRLSGELTDAKPALRLFYGTAAMGIIDVVARAAPSLATRTLFVDRTPAVRWRSGS